MLRSNHISGRKVYVLFVRTRILSPAGLLHVVRWLKPDVSAPPICSIFKGEAVQEEAVQCSPLMVERICNPETSVLKHLKPRKNPEGGRVYFNQGGSFHFEMCLKN